MHKFISLILVLIFTSIAAALPIMLPKSRFAVSKAHAASPRNQVSEIDQFIQEEALLVYHTNKKRRAAGLPPLRWNRELSNAARQFAWDSVENRTQPYCGHEDSLGRTAAERMADAGYTAALYKAENVFCSSGTPQNAVDAWMGSEAHRANILSPEHREIGTGYYENADGRGYIVQKFARDEVFAPVIINDEALSTATPEVNLYIYDHIPTEGFMGIDAATEMMIANSATFDDAVWEPFAAEKGWTLEAGEGWRSVFVKLRDEHGRITVSSDAIYLGEAEVSTPEWDHASTVTGLVSAEDLHNQFADAATWSQVQFGLNWLLDDSSTAFQMVQGSGGSVPDADATGGTTFRMAGSASDLAFAWFWSPWPVVEQAMVAYIRVKVSDNTSGNTVFEFSLDDGTTTYGPLTLSGADFTHANKYQEFALPFSVAAGADPAAAGGLAINLFRTSTADVSVDSVSFFTAAQPMNDALLWTLPNASQRSRGLLTRATTNGTNFSLPQDTVYYPGTVTETVVLGPVTPEEPDPASDTEKSELIVSQSQLEFNLLEDESATVATTASITCENCPGSDWWATSDAEWLSAQRNSDHVDVSVSAVGMQPGTYHGTVTLQAAEETDMAPTYIHTTLNVEPASAERDGATVFLPLVTKQ